MFRRVKQEQWSEEDQKNWEEEEQAQEAQIWADVEEREAEKAQKIERQVAAWKTASEKKERWVPWNDKGSPAHNALEKKCGTRVWSFAKLVVFWGWGPPAKNHPRQKTTLFLLFGLFVVF